MRSRVEETQRLSKDVLTLARLGQSLVDIDGLCPIRGPVGRPCMHIACFASIADLESDVSWWTI